MKDLSGIVVPVTTPFSQSGDIDESAFRKILLFCEKAGVNAVAVGGSTGEGHTLTGEEVRRLCELAIDTVGSRLPVLGSVIVDSTREAIAKVKLLDDLRLSGLQVTPVHYLFKPTAAATVEHFQQICRHTRFPVLIYNVIPWNYLSAELLVRIMREVPGVRGVKQSHADLKLFADLRVAAPRDRWIFTAVDGLLYPSFVLGAKGAISALPSAIPRQCVELWNLVAAGRHAEALVLHEKLLVMWNALLCDYIPAAVKYALALQGLPSGHVRAPMTPPDAGQREGIRAALANLGIGLQEVA